MRTEAGVTFQGQPDYLRKGKGLVKLILFCTLLTYSSIHKEKAASCQCYFMGLNLKLSDIVMCVFKECSSSGYLKVWWGGFETSNVLFLKCF